ncbi:hypothetical protein ES705_28144 [subsurface metagenome]
MKNLTKLLQENKTDPNKNYGWNFNFKFIQEIATKTEEIGEEEYVPCESVNAVLLVLFESLTEKEG